MSIGALDAAAAYGRATTIGASAPEGGLGGMGGMGGAAAGLDATDAPAAFGDMIQTIVTDATKNLHAAETASVRQVAGKGDMIDVATAIGAAEVALDTVVAVRDRVVAAYSEIMRMQI